MQHVCIAPSVNVVELSSISIGRIYRILYLLYAIASCVFQCIRIRPICYPAKPWAVSLYKICWNQGAHFKLTFKVMINIDRSEREDEHRQHCVGKQSESECACKCVWGPRPGRRPGIRSDVPSLWFSHGHLSTPLEKRSPQPAAAEVTFVWRVRGWWVALPSHYELTAFC